MDRLLAVMSVSLRRPEARWVLVFAAPFLGLVCWLVATGQVAHVEVVPAILLTMVPFAATCLVATQAMQLMGVPQMAAAPRAAAPHVIGTFFLPVTAVLLAGGLAVAGWTVTPWAAAGVALAGTAVIGPWAWTELRVLDGDARLTASTSLLSLVPITFVTALAFQNADDKFLAFLQERTAVSFWITAGTGAASLASWVLFARLLGMTARGAAEQGRVISWGATTSTGATGRDRSGHGPVAKASSSVDAVTADGASVDLPKRIAALRPGIPMLTVIIVGLSVTLSTVLASGLAEADGKNDLSWREALGMPCFAIVLFSWVVPFTRWLPVTPSLPRLSLAPLSRTEFMRGLDAVVRRDVLTATGVTVPVTLFAAAVQQNSEARWLLTAIGLATVWLIPAARAFMLWDLRHVRRFSTAFVGWAVAAVVWSVPFATLAVWFLVDDPLWLKWVLTPPALLTFAGSLWWLRHEQHWWATADLALLERQGE